MNIILNLKINIILNIKIRLKNHRIFLHNKFFKEILIDNCGNLRVSFKRIIRSNFFVKILLYKKHFIRI